MFGKWLKLLRLTHNYYWAFYRYGKNSRQYTDALFDYNMEKNFED